MPTHQQISGVSDEVFVQRMVASYPERFSDVFWKFFTDEVMPRVPSQPVVMDLGCGPGLFLQDVAGRYTPSALHGYDITPAMIAQAQTLAYNGTTATLAVHDLTAGPLPVAAGSVHLVHMSAVLHVLDDPYPVLADIRRVLASGGIFVLNDWIRSPLPVYLESRTDHSDDPEADRQRWFRLFPVHNKYTPEDWQWLLDSNGFQVHHKTQVRPHFNIFVTTAVGGK
jgi:SAM-dependent methyltransferase